MRFSVRGRIWSATEQALWFVDIKAPAIHRFTRRAAHSAPGPHRRESASCFRARAAALIAGLKTGLHKFNPETGNFTLLHVVEPHAPNNRLNDGFVDSQGFLWFGSMDDNEEEPSGALYQLNDTGCIRRDPGYVVTNGPAESPDGTRAVSHRYARRNDLRLRSHAHRQPVQQTRVCALRRRRSGYPDGPIVDAEGCLWTGVFGGWGLQRYSPQGELLQTIRLPCSAVTKAAFAGDDLKTLYITTAHVALDAEQRRQQPLAGGLFRARVDVPGLPQGIVSHGI